MKILGSVDLYFKDPSVNSDKEYHLQLVEGTEAPLTGVYFVEFQYGRCGGALNTGRKIETGDLGKAQKVFEKVRDEKLGKGYHPGKAQVTSWVGTIAAHAQKVSVPPVQKVPVAAIGACRKILWDGDGSEQAVMGPVAVEPLKVVSPSVMIPQLLNPIEEDSVEKYLKDDAWGAQEKKDGRHQMIRVSGGVMVVTNRKGKEVGYPSCWGNDIQIDVTLDGEAIGEKFYAFDLLSLGVEDYRGYGYEGRWEQLNKMGYKGSIEVVPLAYGYNAKKALYDRLKKEGKEGIVFKRLSSVYKPGKGHSDMVKHKFYSSLTVRVCKGREGKQSIGMELLDNGKWVFVGNCTTLNKSIPEGSLCEIKYLYGYPGGSLYQPAFLGIRDDLDESDCVLSQVKYKSGEGV